MGRIEHGLSGKVAGALPPLTERAVGLVAGWKRIENSEEVILYVNNGDNNCRIKVSSPDMKTLNLRPGDGVDVRRLRLGDPDRPADYIKKGKQAAGEKRLIRAAARV